jgi:hypothetical protein
MTTNAAERGFRNYAERAQTRALGWWKWRGFRHELRS